MGQDKEVGEVVWVEGVHHAREGKGGEGSEGRGVMHER